mmetsp:Transcript_11324/g.35957  ORF Transcript_11324/g.35957 Transcript_11324/m.35957 type:complete len:222 (-) Transcript_11324:2744-3409(-)
MVRSPGFPLQRAFSLAALPAAASSPFARQACRTLCTRAAGVAPSSVSPNACNVARARLQSHFYPLPVRSCRQHLFVDRSHCCRCCLFNAEESTRLVAALHHRHVRLLPSQQRSVRRVTVVKDDARVARQHPVDQPAQHVAALPRRLHRGKLLVSHRVRQQLGSKLRVAGGGGPGKACPRQVANVDWPHLQQPRLVRFGDGPHALKTLLVLAQAGQAAVAHG